LSPEFEGRTEYLSLALFSQSLVAELLNFVKSCESTMLLPILKGALTSLRDVQSGEVRRFGRRNAVAFNSYQQLSTLTKAWSDDERESAIRLIERLVENPDDRRSEASQLIDLFTRLQVQALWSFERPEAPPTEGLRELCKMTS
jgi:hypothetical protein